MFYYLKLYLKDWWINIPLVSVLVVQIYIWVYLIMNIRPSLGNVFLHYNIVFGVDLVGSWWKMYFLPLAGLVVLLINYGLSFWFHKNDKFISRLLSFWASLLHLFLLIAVILLVRLNI